MDFHKLKLDKFTTYNGLNMSQEFNPPLEQSNTPEVYFMFVSNVNDVMNAVNHVQNNQINRDNRAFFIFKKGNKAFGRDHVYNIIMTNPKFKRKAPMLASLNQEYSVFCFMYEV